MYLLYADSEYEHHKAWSLIIKHQNWTSIRILWLSGNKITDHSINILLAVEWPHLEQLWLCTIMLLIIGSN